MSVSSALTDPAFKAHFALSDIDRGWVNSAFFWSYAVMQMPMGWVVDRFGVKWPYAISFALWCAASAMIGLMTTLAGLIVMRLLVGAAEAVVVPGTYRWIRGNFDPDRSGAALGFYALGTKFGPALSAPLAAWFITALDWRWMFALTGLTGLVWLLPWVALARDAPPSDRRADAVPRGGHEASAPIVSILANRFILGTLVVYFCYNYFVFFCMTWMPAYLVEQRGLSLERMGIYAFASFAGIALVAFASGWAADELVRRFGRAVAIRKGFVLAGFACAATTLIGARAEDVQTALFWNVVSLSGLGLATANNLALCSMMMIPQPIIGRVKGVQNTAVAIAGIVAPLVTGWLLHLTGSFVAPMAAIVVFLALGAATVLFILRPEWAPDAPA
ncbi:MFS transporter [Stakelama sp. CBK3Z-3]|uniref:MFS transporter n=2 Tax=Stakelama flava TaxID=2860338 RepID=A0ABS6XPH9_9SPHN|nr:MFS transporter [Stakelama flava]